jgi:hypothetical protein
LDPTTGQNVMTVRLRTASGTLVGSWGNPENISTNRKGWRVFDIGGGTKTFTQVNTLIEPYCPAALIPHSRTSALTRSERVDNASRGPARTPPIQMPSSDAGTLSVLRGVRGSYPTMLHIGHRLTPDRGRVGCESRRDDLNVKTVLA